MVNTLKLKARIMEFGLNQKDVAKVLNVAPSTVSQKINNVRPMYLKEADLLADLLKIDTMQFGEYFFSSNIA
ncbi:helix-turn-helix transcriptional regulator [Clostridium botulinum]|uniref:helix-turn-helix domain-containing protein n=1 Tax=Clostridium TaxID=1485 RepID=UPI0005410CC6|nr:MULTISPECIES: helix-turn-helix transcriptional regulator [Clostridium]AIY80745.1 helix-turn-helix family protein [Clostridium botulinum 202F]KAI3347938.1 helix-turn-helix domain-containing protein [Clostridium botulinum]KON14687.1 repressor [Clostridium botulinum]MBN1059383.1 XRE family transcriptional regulator [Clostridium botulinum]MBY6986464.1 helix-turn-helix transcriptional regulator [Clostridium botulinum]